MYVHVSYLVRLTRVTHKLCIFCRERGRGRGNRRRKNKNRNGGGRREDTDIYDAGDDEEEDTDYPEMIDVDGCKFPTKYTQKGYV